MHYTNAKGILSSQNGMNIYRGCTHGCIYCDSRSDCYQFVHDFEDIEVKINAPELLEQKLRSKREKCMIGTGAMCDPYMHCEERLGLTRRCLELIYQYGFGAAVQTKSDMILRDIDLLSAINRRSKAVVEMTLTTLDDTLCSIIEPNVCTSSRRFEVLCEMRKAGIPTVVWMTPILPFINDTEENIMGLLDMCVNAEVKGIMLWNMGLTLRNGSREYFYKALDRNFPGMKEKYHAVYGYSYELISPDNERLMKIFDSVCEKADIIHRPDDVFAYLREFPKEEYEQLSLF